MNFKNITCLPAYTTRDVRNYGTFSAGSLYKFLFTREDNNLLSTGAIKLIPFNMLTFYASHNVVLSGKKYSANETIDIKNFDENTIKILVKTNVLKFDFAEDVKNLSDDKIVKTAKVYGLVGSNFKNASEELGLDFEEVRKAFDIKKNATQKKVKQEDISKFFELLGE